MSAGRPGPLDAAVTLSLADVRVLAHGILTANGVAPRTADILAERIVAAERDGPPSHGLFMMPAYISGLRSGWIDGGAVPEVAARRDALLLADGRGGVAQRALEDARRLLCDMARQSGLALLAIHNAHHIAALRADVEPFAEAGFVAITCITTRPWLAAAGRNKRLLGTNPIAFASPRGQRAPFVWDMATSTIAVTEVRVAAEAGQEIAPGLGLDADGRPTTDARAILDGGMLLPFGHHKGAALAMMVEVLAAGLTGGNFSIEDRSREHPGASSSNGGQIVLLIDPAASAGQGFATRIEQWLDNFETPDGGRVPGDGRLSRRRQSERDGVRVSQALLEQLRACQ